MDKEIIVSNNSISFEELIKILKKQNDCIFRGSVNRNYGLIPGVYRNIELNNIEYIEKEHKEFINFLLKKKKTKYKGDEFFRYLCAQHYGCKTKLLDFSSDFKIALLFSIYDWPTGNINTDCDGVIYVLKKSALDCGLDNKIEELNKLLLNYINGEDNYSNSIPYLIKVRKNIKKNEFDPRERIKKQKGLFIFYKEPFDFFANENEEVISTYIISKDTKYKVKEYLEKEKIFFEDIL